MFGGSVVWRGIVYTILMTIGKLTCGLWLLRIPNPFTRLQSAARLIKNTITRKNQPLAPRRQAREGAAAASAASSRTSLGKPLSVYPGLILGSAMVSRGEIGYLISSIAEGGGVFGRHDSTVERRASAADPAEQQPSEIFLIVTWAITLCTVVGPVSMGLLVRRVRRLENKAGASNNAGSRSNVLGSWGVG